MESLPTHSKIDTAAGCPELQFHYVSGERAPQRCPALKDQLRKVMCVSVQPRSLLASGPPRAAMRGAEGGQLGCSLKTRLSAELCKPQAPPSMPKGMELLSSSDLEGNPHPPVDLVWGSKLFARPLGSFLASEVKDRGLYQLVPGKAHGINSLLYPRVINSISMERGALIIVSRSGTQGWRNVI